MTGKSSRPSSYWFDRTSTLISTEMEGQIQIAAFSCLGTTYISVPGKNDRLM